MLISEAIGFKIYFPLEVNSVLEESANECKMNVENTLALAIFFKTCVFCYPEFISMDKQWVLYVFKSCRKEIGHALEVFFSPLIRALRKALNYSPNHRKQKCL